MLYKNEKAVSGDHNTNPLVSVLVLNHNQGRWITEALNSILAQDYPCIELIIFDDGSTDESKDVIHNWINENWQAAIFLFNETKSGNISSNMNKMLASASGIYIAINAADDRMRATRISSQVNSLKANPRAILSFGYAHLIDENSNSLDKNICGVTPPFLGNIQSFQVGCNCIPTCTALFCAISARQLGGFDETLFLEDYDMWLRMSTLGDFIALNQVLADYRLVRNTSISLGHTSKMHRSAEQSLIKFCKNHRLQNPTKTVASKSILNIAICRRSVGSSISFADAARVFESNPTLSTFLALMLCLRLPSPLIKKVTRLIFFFRAKSFSFGPPRVPLELLKRADFWLNPY